MHPEVAEALESLGWVTSESSTSTEESQSANSLYEQIFNELSFERDDRSPPDSLRYVQFKIGWKNATLQRRIYTDKTLKKRLTWNNLGYRFGTQLGQCSDSEIDQAYNFLAQHYNIQGKESVYNNPTTAEVGIFPDEVCLPNKFREGAVSPVSVNAYERNPKARQGCLNHYGTHCFVCGFDFNQVFGDLGKGFIHVHHLRPLSEISEEYEVDPVKDLRPVCPNCHAMIHRRHPPFSIEEIKLLLKHFRYSAGITQ